jgi:phospholipase/lecithinase/hemolysin
MRTASIHKHSSLFVSAVAAALLSCQALAQHSSIDRVVAFGASLTDSGNAFVWLSEPENRGCGASANVPPFDLLDDFLAPDGPYATGGHHYSNGATWVEGLGRSLALAGNARPALQNTGIEASNYAVGGARAVADYRCRFNLPAQIGVYVDDFAQTSARTLVAIEIGGNDVRDALVAAAGGQSPAPYIQSALGSLAGSITRLYFHGARKFLVLNVPDIGKSPAVRMLDQVYPGIAEFAGVLASAYNDGLLGVVQALGALPGIDVRILDIHATLNDVVAHPGTHGFVNATAACITPNQPPFKCTKPDTYVFWDGIHPTRALHAIIAQQAIAVISAP